MEARVAKAPSPLASPPVVLAQDATSSVLAAVSGNVGLVVWAAGSNLEAQRFDPSGAPLGPVIQLGAPAGQGTPAFGVAGGNGVFAVVAVGTSAHVLDVRRIGDDGTALDPAWVPVTNTLQSSTLLNVAVGWNGAGFTADFVQLLFDWNWTNEQLLSAPIPSSGPVPLTIVNDTPGYPSKASYHAVANACIGGSCARLYTSYCDTYNGAPVCPFNGVFITINGVTKFVGTGGNPSLGAGAGNFFVTHATPDHAALLDRFDTSGNHVGDTRVLSLNNAYEGASAFDGADVAFTYRGAENDLHDGFCTAAGQVELIAPELCAQTPEVDASPAMVSFGGGESLLFSRAGNQLLVRTLSHDPVGAYCAGPTSALADGTFGPLAKGSYGVAAANGTALVVRQPTTGPLAAAVADSSLHVTTRDIGEGAAAKIAVATSGNGFLAVVENGTLLSLRRFASDGTPLDPGWTPLPVPVVSNAPISAFYDGANYQIFFRQALPNPNCPGCVLDEEPYRLVVPKAGNFGALTGATMIGGYHQRVQGAGAWGSMWVAALFDETPSFYVTLLTPNGSYFFSTAFQSFWNVQSAAVAMGPYDGLVVYQAGPVVRAQRLTPQGAPTGKPISLSDSALIDGTPRRLSVVWDGQMYAVAWETQDPTKIAGTWVDGSGPVYTGGGVLVSDPLGATNPKLVPAAGGGSILAYERASGGASEGVFHALQPWEPKLCDSDAKCWSGSCGATGICCAQSCDDGLPCTTDTCLSDGQTCTHSMAPNGAPCPGGACQSGSCVQSANGGSTPLALQPKTRW